VHRRFEDVDEFVDAIQKLGRRIKANAAQRELFPPETTKTGSHPAKAATANKNHGRV